MCAKTKMEFLSQDEREKIIEQSLSILEEQGVDVHSQEAVDIFTKAGCTSDGIRVRIPRELVRKSIESAPSVIEIYDREGKLAMDLGRDSAYFGPGPTCPSYFDPYTGEKRPARKEDAATTAKLVDALPNIDYAMSLVMIGDQTKVLADVHEIDAMVRNTVKPLAGWAFFDRNAQTMIDICAAVAGGLDNLKAKPFLIVYCEPQTPFVHNEEALGVLMTLARNDIPCIYTPGQIMGATAPVTIAATLSVGLCDCLTGLVLSQIINPGTPFIGGCSGGPMDMKTMNHSYGAPEFVLCHNASAEIFHTLDIPVFDIAGASDSKVVDGQATAEAMLQIVASICVGGNLIHDVGFMDLGLTGSPLYLTLCDELIGMGKRLLGGIVVDEDHLAKDCIEEVGPGGNFVTEDHTLEFFREVWAPLLMDRRGYGEWEKDGATTITDRAQTRMIDILDNRAPKPLPDDVIAKIDAIVAKAEENAKA